MADRANYDKRCPWCGVVQVNMHFPEPTQAVVRHAYRCEQCGWEIAVFITSHVSWTFSLRRPDTGDTREEQNG